MENQINKSLKHWAKEYINMFAIIAPFLIPFLFTFISDNTIIFIKWTSTSKATTSTSPAVATRTRTTNQNSSIWHNLM